ncbi:hypothetical protein V6N13_139776 [Hibiscus sabdariffa]|uniref:Uncharacterized protein n=2 Tax=Hibiscus sabdariffa TaxID=183260 RepID=A0ABR2C782_9ROSI
MATMKAIPWCIIFGLLISNSNATYRETQGSTLDDISSRYFSFNFHTVSARLIRPRRPTPPPPSPKGNFIVHQLAPPPSNPPPPPPKGKFIVHQLAPPPSPSPPPPCA